MSYTPLRPEEDNSPAALRSRLVNAHAEQALLGALLTSNKAYFSVSEIVSETQFGLGVHGRIFAAMGTLIERGSPANPATMASAFAADDALKGVGGIGYLTDLARQAVTIVNAEHYASAIADLAQRRELITACEDAMADAATVDLERPAAAVIEDHERRVAEAAEGKARGRGMVSFAEAAQLAVASAERAYRGDVPFIPTGLSALDRLIGGLLPSDLEVIAARPGMGKTALGLGIATHAALDGRPVIFFSLEQPAEQLAQRALARASGITADRQQAGRIDAGEWGDYIDHRDRVARLPIIIDDTAGLTASAIAARARRAYRRYKPELIVIDHLQLIAGDRRQDRRMEIDEATRKLKALAKELNLPVLLLSQLNRGVEGRDDKRPGLSDLRESGSIEQDADRVIFLYREEYYLRQPQRRQGETDEQHSARQDAYAKDRERAHGMASLIIAKNRHGRGGVVEAHWDAGRMAFEDCAWHR